MSRDETKKLLFLIENSYPNFKVKDASLVDTWFIQLREDDYKVMETALVAFNRTNTTGFAPSIGQLVDIAYKMANPEIPEMEAWSMVRNALSDATYHSLDRWNDLPEPVRKAVTPDQLRSWAMDSNYNEGVAQSNFLRSYRNSLQEHKDHAKLPEAIRLQIEQATQKLLGG